jgi:DNA-binding transcriptional LysR family regulator
MDKASAMQLFIRVLEKDSFSVVAKERGIAQPAVSKQIEHLEKAFALCSRFNPRTS